MQEIAAALAREMRLKECFAEALRIQQADYDRAIRELTRLVDPKFLKHAAIILDRLENDVNETWTGRKRTDHHGRQ